MFGASAPPGRAGLAAPISLLRASALVPGDLGLGRAVAQRAPACPAWRNWRASHAPTCSARKHRDRRLAILDGRRVRPSPTAIVQSRRASSFPPPRLPAGRGNRGSAPAISAHRRTCTSDSGLSTSTPSSWRSRKVRSRSTRRSSSFSCPEGLPVANSRSISASTARRTTC